MLTEIFKKVSNYVKGIKTRAVIGLLIIFSVLSFITGFFTFYSKSVPLSFILEIFLIIVVSLIFLLCNKIQNDKYDDIYTSSEKIFLKRTEVIFCDEFLDEDLNYDEELIPFYLLKSLNMSKDVRFFAEIDNDGLLILEAVLKNGRVIRYSYVNREIFNDLFKPKL